MTLLGFYLLARGLAARLPPMRAYLIVLTVALAGFGDAPWWSFPLAGACLTIDGWWAKIMAAHRHKSPLWSSKITTYFITGALSDMCCAALSYGAGRLLRCWFADWLG